MISHRGSLPLIKWLQRASGFRSLTVISISTALTMAATSVWAQQKHVVKRVEESTQNAAGQTYKAAGHTTSAARQRAFGPRTAASHRAGKVLAENPIPVITVSAASYEGVAVSPGSIVAAFGDAMTRDSDFAVDDDPSQTGTQLPTLLRGVTVRVNGRLSSLYSVGPAQINFVIPPETAPGTAEVVIEGNNGVISRGVVQVTSVVPAMFTANADGVGAPAANLIRIKPNGEQIFESVTEADPLSPDLRKAKSIDLGPDGEQVFLALFVSGVRLASQGTVTVLVGGNLLVPTFVGPQPDFPGVDQINVLIPRGMIGSGVVQVSVSVDEFSTSNLTEIEIGFRPGTAPPQVTIPDGQMGLAGNPMIINGSGFYPNMVDNKVTINGLSADVMEPVAGGIKIMVPYAVQSGKVSVRTPLGEGVSPNDLRIRTSISGIIQNTEGKPIPGVRIKLEDLAANKEVMTSNDGSFVLADVPTGHQVITVDPGGVPVNPPYPKDTKKPFVTADRDNNLVPIFLQQATGPGVPLGGNGGSGLTYGGKTVKPESARTITGNAGIGGGLAASVILEIEGFKLEVQDQTKVKFPNGETSGMINLTPVKNAKAPVNLPLDYFSSAIVQITPFGVELDPGAKLTFPNTDGFPAGAQAILFRYDSDAGVFVKEDAKANVTADGKFIETEQGAIKKTSLYFAAVKQLTTTVTGRVVENSDGRTPVAKATVAFRGQSVLTDASGSFTLRYVPVKTGEAITVEASVLRASGRVDRAKSSPPVAAVISKITKLLLPIRMPLIENRPPTILVQDKIEVEEGSGLLSVPLSVTDPDKGQTVTANLETAPPFVTLTETPAVNAATAYTLRILPDFGMAGDYAIVIKATDSLGDMAEVQIQLTVKPVNRAPSAKDVSLIMDEDNEAKITVEATDPDGDKIVRYTAVTKPANGVLTGDFPSLTYRPNLNFFGTDQFTYKVNDGRLDGNIAVVNITIRSVNDKPVLSVVGPQSIKVGDRLSFAVSASDVDGNTGLSISASALPAGATFTLTPDGTAGQFVWTPTAAQIGEFRLTFNVADSGTPSLDDTKDVIITVAAAPAAPATPTALIR
jgi:uncharacterized protein (TIGR03437 family)